MVFNECECIKELVYCRELVSIFLLVLKIFIIILVICIKLCSNLY